MQRSRSLSQCGVCAVGRGTKTAGREFTFRLSVETLLLWAEDVPSPVDADDKLLFLLQISEKASEWRLQCHDWLHLEDLANFARDCRSLAFNEIDEAGMRGQHGWAEVGLARLDLGFLIRVCFAEMQGPGFKRNLHREDLRRRNGWRIPLLPVKEIAAKCMREPENAVSFSGAFVASRMDIAAVNDWIHGLDDMVALLKFQKQQFIEGRI